jgi:hypothetical protein
MRFKNKRKYLNEYGFGFSSQPKYYQRGMGGGFGGSSDSGGPNTMYTYSIVPLNKKLEPKPSENEFSETINVGDIIKGKEINKGKEYIGSVLKLVKSPYNNTLMYYLILDKKNKVKVKIDPSTAILNFDYNVIESLLERSDEQKLKVIDEYWNVVVNKTRLNIDNIIDNIKQYKKYLIKINDVLSVEYAPELLNKIRTIAVYRKKDYEHDTNYIVYNLLSIFLVIYKELKAPTNKNEIYDLFKLAIINHESSELSNKIYKILKSGFEHELVHHYDELLYGKKYSEQAFKKSEDIQKLKNKTEAYSNLPHEINAFFLTAIKSLSDNEETIYTWEDFWETFLKYFDSYDKLSDQNKRRIQNRAYQYFEYQKINSYKAKSNERVFENDNTNTEEQIKQIMYEKNISRIEAIKHLEWLKEWIKDKEYEQKNNKLVSESLNESVKKNLIKEWSESELFFYHGTPDIKFLEKATKGIHVGTYQAAKEALEARIGIPAGGEWDGTREYGKTLLAGRKTLKKKGPYCETGFNCSIMRGGISEEDYYPTERKERAKFSNDIVIPFDCKPIILKVKIIGEMTNTPNNPHSDTVANGLMYRNLKKGNARRGYYYINDGEDAGSISAVVPNVSFLKIL